MGALYQHHLLYGTSEIGRRHKDFANRNLFISRVILNRTNQIRTPKQVGSRLQQLRGTTRDERVIRILNRGYVDEEEVKALAMLLPSMTTAVNGAAINGELIEVSVVVELESGRYPSPCPEIILEPSVQSVQLRTLVDFQPQTRLFGQMDPSVVLLSPVALVVYSTFEVFKDSKPYWTSSTLLVSDGLQNGQWRYSTSVALELWSVISALPSRSGGKWIEWTVLHTIFRADPTSVRQRAPFAELSYKFEAPNVIGSEDRLGPQTVSDGEEDSSLLQAAPQFCTAIGSGNMQLQNASFQSLHCWNEVGLSLEDGDGSQIDHVTSNEYFMRHDPEKPMGAIMVCTSARLNNLHFTIYIFRSRRDLLARSFFMFNAFPYFHQGDYFHVYIHILTGDFLHTFHARHLTQYDFPPDIAYYPNVSGDASIIIAAGQGCSHVTRRDGRKVYWLLVPPFTQIVSERDFTTRNMRMRLVDWPYADRHEQVFYELKTEDILCAAYLGCFDARRYHPARCEYVVHRVFADKFIHRGVYLIAPSAWRGRAKVVERVSSGSVTSCLECVLPTGRVICVRVLDRMVVMDEGPLFTSMLEEERRSYREDRRPSPYPLTQPLRALAQSMAREEYEFRRARRHERFAALRAVSIGGIVRTWSGTTMTLDDRSPSPGSNIESAGFFDEQGSSSVSGVAEEVDAVDASLEEGLVLSPFPVFALASEPQPPGARDVQDRVDFCGRILIEVVAADYLEFPSGLLIVRYAVIEPRTVGILKKDGRARLIGMHCQTVRLAKNHGPALDRPLCVTIECVPEDGEGPSVILLASNILVHPAFLAEPFPNDTFIGSGPDCRVEELHHLDAVHPARNIDPSLFRPSVRSQVVGITL
ncbi:hypothetical protein C8R43DRAFT_949275 [Mycena crocata]|nr:hypothetical protein C8R43DRAFT_949275 [Mycena crocata]